MFSGSGKGIKRFSPLEFRNGTGENHKKGLASSGRAKRGGYGQARQAPYIKESGRAGIFRVKQ